jgi:hypothetical protein
MGRLVLLLIFCAFVISVQVAGAGTISLQPEVQQVRVDSLVHVSVSAGDIPSVHGYSVTITYDPVRVRCLKATKQAFLSGQTLFFTTIDSVNGQVRIDEAILGTGTASGSGVMALIDFMPRQAGQASLIMSAADVRDGVNQAISVTTAGAALTVTGVNGVQRVGSIPLDYELGQSYPNPCNPSTVIPYALAASGHVSVDIISVAGEHIATLVDEVQDAGYHSVRWEPFRTSQRIATGTYFCLLRSGDFRATSKILVIK